VKNTLEAYSKKIKMKNQTKKINVNLHGHVLARFDNWWRKQYGISGQNLAGILTNKCIEKNLGIYAITDDVFGNQNGKSRFEQIFEEARKLSKNYKIEKLGNNAFVVSKNEKEVYFIDGQSLTVKEGGRNYELLTFGKSSINEFNSFDETIKYLHGEGLSAIAEHPLAEGHYGNMREKLEELCAGKKIDAVEYNGKIAVPNWLAWIPKFNGFTKKRNESAAKIARSYGIPVVANDDSDTLAQIGSAYSIFPKERIKFDNGENIVHSIGELIREDDFDIKKGYVDFLDWVKYAVWNVTLKEQLLGLRKKFLECESNL